MCHMVTCSQASSSPSPPASHLTSSTSYPLQTVGWLECMLPDGSTYYHNRAMHVTTSIDLRDPSSLRRVSSYLKDVPFNVSSATRLPQANYEVWLQDAVIDGGPAAVCHCWIVHSLQIVTSSFAQVCDLGSPVENSKFMDKFGVYHGAHLCRTRIGMSLLGVY